MMVLTNPECRDGKHRNCDGSGWDEAAEDLGSCPCTCHAKPTLYIAGPMTGLPGCNYPAFHQAEGNLRAAGYRTLNPARNTTPIPETWEGYMRAAITQLVQAGGVAVLPG